jgi:hypothetical protein
MENFMLLFCMGMDFVRSPWHMLDIFVVSMSIFLEVVFMDQPEGGLLIIARSWRFARIGHGLYETTRDKEKAEIQQYLACYTEPLSRAATQLQNMVRPGSRQSHGSSLKLARSLSRSSSRAENSMGVAHKDEIWEVLRKLHDQDPSMIPTVLLVAHRLLEKQKTEEGHLLTNDDGTFRSEASGMSVSLMANNSEYSVGSEYPSLYPSTPTVVEGGERSDSFEGEEARP